MKLNSFTLLARETVATLDQRPDLKLSFKEIHDAAERKELVQHLATRYGKDADLSLRRFGEFSTDRQDERESQIETFLEENFTNPFSIENQKSKIV